MNEKDILRAKELLRQQLNDALTLSEERRVIVNWLISNKIIKTRHGVKNDELLDMVYTFHGYKKVKANKHETLKKLINGKDESRKNPIKEVFLKHQEKRIASKAKDKSTDTEYQKYLKSKQWALIRDWLFYYRGHKCEQCKATTKLQIHHLNYDRIFDERPDDLIILCDNCHKKEHGIK